MRILWDSRVERFGSICIWINISKNLSQNIVVNMVLNLSLILDIIKKKERSDI